MPCDIAVAPEVAQKKAITNLPAIDVYGLGDVLFLSLPPPPPPPQINSLPYPPNKNIN